MIAPFVALLLATAAGVEYRGTLEPRLTAPPLLHRGGSFARATQQQKRALHSDISSSDKVFAGTIDGATAFVVEHEGVRPTLYVDVNRDGRITPNEKFSLGPGMDDLQAGVVLVSFRFPVVHQASIRFAFTSTARRRTRTRESSANLLLLTFAEV